MRMLMDMADQSFNLSIDGGSEAESSQTGGTGLSWGTSSNAEAQVHLTLEE